MAWLEKRGGRYHISFFHGGRHYSRSLKTSNVRQAESLRVRLEDTLAEIERGRLDVPQGADLPSFLLSEGKVAQKVVIEKELTLREFLGRYQEEVPVGAKDASSRYTEDIHVRHLLRLIGDKAIVRSITAETLQGYVKSRADEEGLRGAKISHITIRKEIGTFGSIWNRWALPLGLVSRPAPTHGLLYRKQRVRAPFQTYQQILRQVEGRNLQKDHEEGLWDSVFLTLAEIEQVIEHVKSNARACWVYPMFVFAARTGARRSEILRADVADIDFAGNIALIREKKRDRTRELTFRHVPLSPFLVEVMREWQTQHAGGRFLICEEADVPITVQTSNYQFRAALAGSKWAVLPGWHVFRHSFASNCALNGLDQRIIDEWMGHQTEDMRRRYRHLFPHQQQQAIRLVFGDR